MNLQALEHQKEESINMGVQEKDDHEQLTTGQSAAPKAGTISMLEEEENYPEPGSLQEELNEILEAFFEVIPDEDIRAYQRYVEDVKGERIAENALIEPSMAPDFKLKDQDGDLISLNELLKKGPVVLAFYRGKWCPHCNVQLCRYQRDLVPALKKYNATLVAISPMMPDGTEFLATKFDLGYSVCSDYDNKVAKDFRVTMTVQPHTQPFMTRWGEHVPTHNWVDSWDIPIPATYVIGQDGRIAWSFLDNDPGIRAEAEDILEEVANATIAVDKTISGTIAKPEGGGEANKRPSKRKLFNRAVSATFGNLKKPTSLFKSKSKAAAKVVNADRALGIAMGADFSDDSSLSDSISRLSVRSDGARLTSAWKKRTRKRWGRKTRSQTESPMEFLGQYMVG